MSNLQNLTSKIMQDAEFKAENTIKEARNKEVDIINRKKDLADKVARSMVESAEIENKALIERAISSAQLEARNKKLLAKQGIFSMIFDEVEDRLRKMNLDDYQQFVRSSILSLDIEGDEEIIMSIDDKAKLPNDFISNLNNELINSGRVGNLRLSEDSRDLRGGYILSKNGIDINNSFKAMITSLRDELEFGVNKILFEEN
jgi:V/A-type H+-transporting ATPase subunit E